MVCKFNLFLLCYKLNFLNNCIFAVFLRGTFEERMQAVQSPLRFAGSMVQEMGWGGVAIHRNILSFFSSVLIAFIVILYTMSIYFLIRLKVDCKFKMKKLYLENLTSCNVIVPKVLGTPCTIFQRMILVYVYVIFLCKRLYFSSIF